MVSVGKKPYMVTEDKQKQNEMLSKVTKTKE
jgi:hypothetical protein